MNNLSGGPGRLATWHLPGGPVGPLARWAAMSNVKGGSGTKEGAQGLLARGGLYYLQGPLSSIVMPLLAHGGRSA